MKTAVRLSIALSLVLAILAGVTATQAALVSYDSGFQVQNLEATDASITIMFYDRDGNAVTTVTDTITAGSSNTYFPLTDLGNEGGNVPTGFDGSVVIASDKKVAAITNISGSDGSDPLAYGASYNGFTGGSNTVNLPLLMKGNFGFDTWFSVQNVGSVDASVTVTYSDGVVVGPLVVKPGAAGKYEQATEAHAAGWVGSAIVESTGAPVAVAVLEVGTDTLFAYNGFGSGSTLPVMPLVNMNNFGYVTGIQIQNAGSTDTNVTVSYTPGTPPLGTGTACTETRTIPAGQSRSFGLYVFTNFADPVPSSLISENCVVGETFVGAAKVTVNSANQDLVGIVNQLNAADSKGNAYIAFDPAGATSDVVFPLIMDRNYGYFTGFNVANAGTTTIAAADLTCTVTGTSPSGAVSMDFNPTADIPAGGAWNLVNNNTLADRFVGSAYCTGPAGSQLLGIVNELRFTAGADTALAYEGTNP